MIFHNVQVHDLPAPKFDVLMERLSHFEGLSITPDKNGYTVSGDGLSGRIAHDATNNVLQIELQQIPTLLTPGDVVGRLYDEILSSHAI